VSGATGIPEKTPENMSEPMLKENLAAGTPVGQRERIEISAEAVNKIQGLYDAGLMIQAYNATQELGPLRNWTGTARTLAGRLASNLGAYKLARALHWRALKEDKGNFDLAAYYGNDLLHRRGPLATSEFLERCGEPGSSVGPDALMHFLTLRATVASGLRDFVAAEAFMVGAMKAAPENPWVVTTQAHILEAQDRYGEALEAAKRALELKRWYRPGIQAVGHLLQLLDRDQEALPFLEEATMHIENMHVARQLSLLQQELALYDSAAATLARFEELAPLREKAEQQWLERHWITLDCLRRNLPSALARSQTIPEPYYQEMAKRLETTSNPKLVKLAVPFVRQHHMTCAPATLSAISRFWGKPAEHLEVAEAICYDGTPAHSERHWAETQGWIVREFKVTWDAAIALLDRGIPFTLTTSEATSAHLQAVIGYDEARQTLWIRDPFVYSTSEFIVKPFLERYAATGPRGMALVPLEKRELLEGLPLPELELYDALHSVQHALEENRRSEALETCQRMQAEAGEHRLTLSAQRAIAIYDSNIPANLECLESLLKQFPEDGNLNLCKLGCLRELARRDARLVLLESRSRTTGCDPIFWQQYAQELRADAREHPTASMWIRWALRYRPTDPALVGAWADLLWDKGDFARATRHYYLASCLGEKREQYARSYFTACRHLRQTEPGLEFLKRRHERLGKKSPDPTITFVESLQHLGRTNEAFEALETALARRPRDGVLKLFGANFYGRFSLFQEADKLLREARDSCPPVAWHRAKASLADYQNQKLASLQNWREVLNLEPLAHDAIRATAVLVAETEGREKAIALLDELCERFPFSCPLLTLRIDWLKDEGLDAVIPRLRQLLEVNPSDAWGWRELAVKLSAKKEHEQAIKAANEAIRLEPSHSAAYSVRGDVFLKQGKPEESRADLREALRLEVDNEYALVAFVESAPTLGGRKEALGVVAEELRRQVIFREALSAYQHAARGVLTPEEVLNLLNDAHTARPDLWQTWSVLINQLVDVGRSADALNVARIATERFPLLPRLWLDFARVERSRLEVEGEAIALRKALEISPGYSLASRQLADAYDRQNDFGKALKVLEEAVAVNPLDAHNHGYLARGLWKVGERDKAVSRMQHAIRLQPGYEWGWKMLGDWAVEMNRPHLAIEAARDLTRLRAGEERSWLMLARSLSSEKSREEFFGALDRVVALNPLSEEAYDLRAWALAHANRFEEALEWCRKFPENRARLRLRAAWVEAQQGNLGKALARAKETLTEHPDNYWGWQLLSEWHLRLQQVDESVKAAENMAALAPLQPVPLGYLGDLKLRLGDREGAKAAFHRAFTLDPDYQYAGSRLFDLYLSDQKLAEAERVLKVLSRQGQTSETLASAIELAMVRKEWPSPLEMFGQLCQHEKADLRSFARATKALGPRDSRRKLDRIIHQHLFHGTPGLALAEFWVERHVKKGKWGLHKRLGALMGRGEAGRRAIRCYLGFMGEAFEAAKHRGDVTTPLELRFHLWRLLRHHRRWLKTDVEGWGKVGYVLTCIGRPNPVINWMADWRQQSKSESWMLYNLTTMLHRKGRYTESREVVRRAVRLRHSEDLYQSFRVWAAFEAALEGELPAAGQHLETLSADEVKHHLRPLFEMTRLLIARPQEQASGEKAFFARIQAKMKSSFGKRHPSASGRYVRDGYRRFIRAVTQDSRDWRFRLWCRWYYRGLGWLWAPGMLVIIPLIAVAPPLAMVAIAAFVIMARRKE
jgi:tetratricopeptide (TPR) repeat protein